MKYKDDYILYGFTVGDVQRQAKQILNRELTLEELSKFEDKFTMDDWQDYINDHINYLFG